MDKEFEEKVDILIFEALKHEHDYFLTKEEFFEIEDSDVMIMCKQTVVKTIEYLRKEILEVIDYEVTDYQIVHELMNKVNDIFILKNLKEEEVEQKTIPITLGLIKATCGWVRFCEVTRANEWMLSDYSVDNTEIFQVKEEHAKTLGFIK